MGGRLGIDRTKYLSIYQLLNVMSFTFYLLSPVYPFHLSCNVYAEREGVQKWWRGRLVMDSTNDLSLPLAPRSTMQLGVWKWFLMANSITTTFTFPSFLRSKSRSWPGLHPRGYFKIRAVFLAARETNFFNTLTILFNTIIFVWVKILKGFFIHWKITFYDWHLVTLRIVLVSRMTWMVGKLTTHLPETRGILVETGRKEKVVWSRMTWN